MDASWPAKNILIVKQPYRILLMFIALFVKKGSLLKKLAAMESYSMDAQVTLIVKMQCGITLGSILVLLVAMGSWARGKQRGMEFICNAKNVALRFQLRRLLGRLKKRPGPRYSETETLSKYL
jgi:hypothetical protein